MSLDEKIKNSFDEIDDLRKNDGLNWILTDDVKQFIKELREEFVEEGDYGSLTIKTIINSLAGKGLI